MAASVHHYFKETGGILYSYFLCLPLLLLYELLILISQPDTDYLIRISVDVWMKSFFSFLGINPVSATLYLAAVAGAVIVYRKRDKLKSLRKKYFFYMILESLFYAVLISLIIGSFLGFLLNASADGYLSEMSKLQLIALSLGAGLYEELFFRVILVGILIFLFKKVITHQTTLYLTAATVAALIFSGVHYIGVYGDVFTISSFLFRFLFGLALNVIYVKRGFGMAACTHAIYDLIVVLNL